MSENNDQTRRTGRAPSQGRSREGGQAQRRTASRKSSGTRPAAQQQSPERRAAAPRNTQRGSASAPRQTTQRRPSPSAQQRRPAPRREEYESSFDIGSFIKGTIAVGLTCFIVCVIVIMFAKTLFVSDAELQQTAKTGHLTETAFEMIEPVEQQLREEVVTTKATKKKKTTTTQAETEAPADLPEGIDASIAGDYTVNSPVYLHPTADANASNLATLPYGVTVKVLGSSYGWYYLEYEGQKGYAWGTYFTKAG